MIHSHRSCDDIVMTRTNYSSSIRRITIRCTRSRGPRGFFCLQDFRRGPVIVVVIRLRYSSATLRRCHVYPNSTASPSTSTSATTIRRISTRSTVIPRRSSKFAPVLYWRVGYHAELRSLLPNGASFTAKPCLQTGLWPKHSNRCCQSNRWTDDHDPSHSQRKTCWTNFAICSV